MQTDTAGPSSLKRDKSKLQCHQCGVFGHIKRDGKCKPEDIEKWQKKNFAQTVNQMKTKGSSYSDSDDRIYRVALCMTHEDACYSTGKVVDEDVRIETVMNHLFDDQHASVIPLGSVGIKSMSSVNVFDDRRLLPNMRTVRSRMTNVCNAGEV